ncbi:MAG: mannose-1-phosphate guanylyltransferase/mannose-6-phosphate isomerase [Candidatus Gastranaerophilales bacterium]|nr:mannose-1-phosphate guanylyltransferase/mannose-6-phosphate isomerase [Candidatus Gastranaerophilales bacterium]
MHGIILAGGSGSRLWPLSRDLYPKQLLKLNSDKSLLEKTYERLMGIMDIDNILAITNSKHIGSVRMQLSQYNKDVRVLAEPVAKNTAPAIAVATKYLLDFETDDIVLVVPSDHLINDFEGFRKTVKEAEKLAKEGYLVTIGVKPKNAGVGYGYIKAGEKIEDGYKVDSFKEKPDKDKALEYFNDKSYYWNSGILIFRASVFMETLKENAPEIYENTVNFNFKIQDDIEYMRFNQYPSISVDYAVMEHAKNIAMVEMLSDWSDMGSWEAVYSINNKDKDGNVEIGNIISKDCQNSMLYSSGRLLTGVGLKDVIVVETPDAVLVCDRNDTQGVKEVFETLRETKNDTHRIHTTVYRPWGYYTVLNQGDGYLTTMICVSRKGQLSLQSHNHRSEHWVVLSGTARVTLEDKVFMLKAGSSIDIPVRAVHSLANPYDTELKIIEVQKGDLLVEEDIVRYKDIYGRATKK